MVNVLLKLVTCLQTTIKLDTQINTDVSNVTSCNKVGHMF